MLGCGGDGSVTMCSLYVNFFCQEVEEMRDCYDSLLSAAAATANSAYGKILFFLK